MDSKEAAKIPVGKLVVIDHDGDYAEGRQVGRMANPRRNGSDLTDATGYSKTRDGKVAILNKALTDPEACGCDRCKADILEHGLYPDRTRKRKLSLDDAIARQDSACRS